MGSSGGLIVTARTSPNLFCPFSNCTCSSHIITNISFLASLQDKRACKIIYRLWQQTSLKRWFGNVNMTSECDVAKSAYPVTITTIRHCSKREFGRGHTIKQSPRASPDLCKPLSQGFTNFTAVHFVAKCHIRKHFAKVPSMTLALEITLVRSIIQPLLRISDHRWGSKQRPIWKQTALGCLKAPVSSPQTDKAHTELCLVYQAMYQYFSAFCVTLKFHFRVLKSLRVLVSSLWHQNANEHMRAQFDSDLGLLACGPRGPFVRPAMLFGNFQMNTIFLLF